MLVPQTNCRKRIRCLRTHDFISDSPEAPASLGRTHRNSHDDTGRLVLTQRADGGFHSRPGCEAIIDDNDDTVGELQRWTVAAIEALAPLELETLARSYLINDGTGDAQLANDRFAHHAHVPDGDGAHRELRLARNTELTHEEHVERSPELARHFQSHRDATTRQPQDDDVLAISVGGEPRGELLAGVGAIMESHGDCNYPLAVDLSSRAARDTSIRALLT
jgi:hypothetical protein